MVSSSHRITAWTTTKDADTDEIIWHDQAQVSLS